MVNQTTMYTNNGKAHKLMWATAFKDEEEQHPKYLHFVNDLVTREFILVEQILN